jgi:hypothetical protein
MTFKTQTHRDYFNLKFPHRETLVYMAEQIKAFEALDSTAGRNA